MTADPGGGAAKDAGGTNHPPTTDIDSLFTEFVDALDEGQGPDPIAREGLLGRAGDRRDELEERMRLYESLMSKDPAQLGRFEILAKMGDGGLGRVYLARDPELGRNVAIKVLERGGNLGKLERDWVLNEARSLAKLEHPGVVRVFEVGDEDGVAFLVMEHLSGPSLHEVITELRRRIGAPASDGDQPEALTDRQKQIQRLASQLAGTEARVECLAKLADALGYCHGRGVLHRDVKPGNILFDKDDEPRLIDFGLAHLADSDSGLDITQHLIGSPGYIAPEQVELGRTGDDPRSDQFVLGVVSYELLTCKSPFERPTRSLTMSAIAEARPPRLRSKMRGRIPIDLDRIIHHTLEQDPNDRYPNVSAYAGDLRAVLDHRPISVERPSTGRIIGLWLRRHRRPVIATIAAALIFVLVWAGLRVVEERAEHARLRQGWAGWVAEHHSGPAALIERGEALRGHLVNAARFDEESAFGRSLGRLQPLVKKEMEVWSERVREVAALERFDAPDRETTLQSTTWRSLFDLERSLLPDRDDPEDFWRRGRVYFEAPEGTDLTLLEQTPLGPEMLSGTPSYTRIDLSDDLVPGFYRVVATPPGSRAVVSEVEFIIDGYWGPAVEIPVLPLEPSLLAKTIEVPATTIEVNNETYRIGPFRILTHLIPADAPGLDGRTYRDASEFARSVGGRLPTSLELRAAYQRGLPIGEDAYGEWVSDWLFDQPFCLGYYCIDEFIAMKTLNACLKQGMTDGVFEDDGSYVRFRIAQSIELGSAQANLDD